MSPEERRQKYDEFMAKYHAEHACCPKCGGNGGTVTLVGYILDLDNTDKYEDQNRYTCGECGDVHTVHDRVPASDTKQPKGKMCPTRQKIQHEMSKEELNIHNDEDLREAIQQAVFNEKQAPIRIPVYFSVEELQDSKANRTYSGDVVDAIMEKVRPKLENRLEAENRKGVIPDAFLDRIAKIEIETSTDEATFKPIKYLCVYLKPDKKS